MRERAVECVPRPTKGHRNERSGKRMATMFLMKSDFIKSVLLKPDQTTNANWYDPTTSLQNRIRTETKEQ
jgi:hypothetical protein